MLVSTIIPVFNRGAMLREAVASVLAQTYRPIEVIVVDDGSTDDTREIAESLVSSEVRVIRQRNAGPGLAREKGRLEAQGEFIQYLDSDDLLLPEKFSKQVAALNAHPECGAAYGWTRFRDSSGAVHPKPWKRSGERIETAFPAMLQSRWWDTPTPLYRASVIRENGPWLGLRMEEDWEYDARLASRGLRLAYVEDWVCEVRATHGLSGHAHTPETLRDRAQAHALILGHARAAGIRDDAPEMRHFARELFLLARQCGAAGLGEESKTLFTLSREASGDERNRMQFRVYAAIARVVGWANAGKLLRW